MFKLGNRNTLKVSRFEFQSFNGLIGLQYSRPGRRGRAACARHVHVSGPSVAPSFFSRLCGRDTFGFDASMFNNDTTQLGVFER